MDSFENIKQIWSSEKALDLPNSTEIKSAIDTYHSGKKRNIYLLIALLILCLIIFVLVMVFHKPLLWTTTVGEILILIGFILGISLKLKTLKKATQNELKSNKDFLEDLKKSIRKKSEVNLLQIIALLFISVGYVFFIYETVRNSKTDMLFSYSGITLFVLGVYFISDHFPKANRERNRKNCSKILRPSNLKYES